MRAAALRAAARRPRPPAPLLRPRGLATKREDGQEREHGRHEQQQQQQQHEEQQEPASEKQARHEELMGKLRAWMETSLLVQLRRVNEVPDMKLFEGNEMLIPREDAEEMPPLTVEAITGQQIAVPSANKVTMLLLSFNDLGFGQLPSWREPVERHLHEGMTSQKPSKKRTLQIVTVSAVENKLYQALSGFIGRAFAKSVNPRHADSTAAFYGDFSPWKPALGIKNRFVGYAFLIDPDGLVRWRGCAECNFHESLQLIRCLNELLREKDPKASKNQ